jgi:DNA repair protein RecN (Recombination protein N)
MLCELRIRNFALIDSLSLRLGPGLNVLTGETGAGKSIIVGALSLLLGERASAEVVRAGTDRAAIEGAFEVRGRAEVLGLLDERGVEADDELLVLKREVAAGGRSRAWINGTPVTAGLLGEVGRLLVDLHGQHEHQTLLRRDEQRIILDAYAGTQSLAGSVAVAWHAHRDLHRQIEELEARRREVAQRADFLRFQLEEISAAQLAAGEEDTLKETERRLSHSEELMTLSAGLAEALSGSDDALCDRLVGLRRQLDALVRIDVSQAALLELYDTAYYAIDELGNRLNDYATSVEHDPERLQEVRRRQDVLFRLCSKYGATVAEVVQFGETVRAELELLDGADWELSALRRREGEARAELGRLAAELSERRASAAGRLAGEIAAVLPELGMKDGRFEVVLLPLGEPGASGAEEVEFRVALNRGFDPRPLAQVASGGELSRVMLAVKTILARLDSVPTLVFDEVDAGIGGRVALQVGEKMRSVAASHQVFAITHLPQIAARAHTHLLVSKQDTDGRAATRVQNLEAEARVAEIARMLGGDIESRISLDHARELLDRGAADPADLATRG